MADKARVPIIDRNGKQTHVWKKNDDGTHSIQRIKEFVDYRNTSSVGGKGRDQNPLGQFIDAFWEANHDMKARIDDYLALKESEPAKGADNRHDLWERAKSRTGAEIFEQTLAIADLIREIELELTGHEANGHALYSETDHENGVKELKLQKSILAQQLERGNIHEEWALHPLVYRTQEDSVQKARDIYGSTKHEFDTINGGKGLIFTYQDPSDHEIEFRIDRLGNVGYFSDERTGASYSNSTNIDFPHQDDEGRYQLKGWGGDKLPANFREDIIMIATGNAYAYGNGAAIK